MSGADFEAMEYWEMGLSDVPEKSICADHIEDYAVKEFIGQNGIPGKCDYWRRRKKVVELDALMRFLMAAVSHFYTEPLNFMRYDADDGELVGQIYNGWEILTEVWGIELDDLILDDVYHSINLERGWGDETEYYDDEAEFLKYHWEYFKQVVKHRSRYLFANTGDLRSADYRMKPYDILLDIGKKAIKYKLVSKVPKGTRLVRCRQHPKKVVINAAAQICSPPEADAITPNRMSPAGISMFYAAFDEGTCLKETLDIADPFQTYYTLATFETKSELTVIDFSRIPAVPSVFDQKKWDDFYSIIFLLQFVEDLTKPIARDAKVHIEYVATQIVTEFFRYAFRTKRKSKIQIDGIVYPSSRNKGKKACVLFYDHEESLNDLKFIPSMLKRNKVAKTFD